MKKALLVFMGLLLNSNVLMSQTFIIPTDSTIDVNTPGRTLTEILNLWEYNLDPADTNEGGGRHGFQEFKSFWGARVDHNDSSGINMFSKYCSALQFDRVAKMTSTCGSNGFL